MRIGSSDRENRKIFSPDGTPDTGADELAQVQAEPSNADIAAKLEANTKSSEKTQVVDPAFGKGSIVNDMA